MPAHVLKKTLSALNVGVAYSLTKGGQLVPIGALISLEEITFRENKLKTTSFWVRMIAQRVENLRNDINS